MKGAHLLLKQPCPHCGYPAIQGHISFCNGDVVLCDLCQEQTPITRDYHSIYQHYAKHHVGKRGALLEGMKQGQRNGSKKGERQQARVKREPSVEQLVPITIILPLGKDRVRCHFVKSFATWKRLVQQGPVWDSKSEDELALACAVATFRVEYL